ncbi:C40 family peptidase [Nocardia amamiensis]|uniref:C40 family peptidase n=1 Tax=Nocardia amamiensis TaxID=404578 RepID=A0ABS0CXD7_9NOCA|nr:NlpC/P60 family protein [Nocardia amamiensis]MBF6301268.1 C40 family peptidase [Nocardia amamiensis]
MIGRLLILAMIPAWVWVVLAVTTGLFGVVVVLVLVVGGATSSIASDLHYQCDSVVGPDPSQTVTPSRATAVERPTARSTPAAGVYTAPTTNPFAELTIAPDDTSASDWQRACASALKDAPYQNAPLLTGSAGTGAQCARELALAQLGAASSASGARNGTGGQEEAAGFARSIIYGASAAESTGRCELAAGPVAQPPAGDAGRPGGSARRACGQSDSSGVAVVVLPHTIAAQGACGQRVDPSAVSAGDLVFWDYRNNAPTHVGIAVSATQLVTADSVTGGFVQLTIPSRSDVRVKRVLGSGT